MRTFAEHSTLIDSEIEESHFLTNAVTQAKSELKRWYLDKETEDSRLRFEHRIMIAKAREYNAQRINTLAFEIANLQTSFDADRAAQVAAFNAIDTLLQLNQEYEDDAINEMMDVVEAVYTPKLLVVLFRDEHSINGNMRLIRGIREAKLTGDIDKIVSVLLTAKALRAVKQK